MTLKVNIFFMEEKMKNLLMVLLLVSSISVFSQTAEQVVDRMNESMIYDSAKLDAKMLYSDRFGQRISTMNLYMKGSDKSVIEFTSKAEKGQKILQTKNEVYLYFPQSEKVRKIQGAAMREGVNGTNVSYDDMMGNKSIKEDFNLEKLPDDKVGDISVFKIKLTAKNPKEKAYPINVLYVNQANYSPVKFEKFSINEKLLQTIEFSDVRPIGKLNVAFKLKIQDMLQKNSYTEITYNSLDLNAKIDEGIFSLSNLSW